MKTSNSILFIIIAFLFISCDKGLEPPESISPAVLIGKVKFINKWPKSDSVFGIRAGAFKSPPTGDLLQEVLNGDALFKLETLGYGLDSANFEFIIKDLPIELKYIVIAWQYQKDISYERVIGVYTKTNDKTKPGTIKLGSGDTANIEIEVDWNDFPPQPF